MLLSERAQFWHPGAVPGIWGVTPWQSVKAECARRGRPSFLAGSIDLLEGRGTDDFLILALGGPHAEPVLSGREGGSGGYWPRVWACRGLLYAWDQIAVPAVVRSPADPAWRVREVAAKLIAQRGLEDALSAVLKMLEDSVPRVRAAAERAAVRLCERSGP